MNSDEYAELVAEIAPLLTFSPEVFIGDDKVPQPVCDFVWTLALVYNDLRDLWIGRMRVFEIAPDEPLDDLRHFGAGKRGADDFSQGSGSSRADLALVAADLDLVPLFAVLVHAQDADMSDVMVRAGVDAA